MTDTEIRIAIAKDIGFVSIQETSTGLWGWVGNKLRELFNLRSTYANNRLCCCEVPDYPNDLNAMRTIQGSLPAQDRPIFQYYLDKVCATKDPHCSLWDIIDADARQRAEAYLKMKGLWK